MTYGKQNTSAHSCNPSASFLRAVPFLPPMFGLPNSLRSAVFTTTSFFGSRREQPFRSRTNKAGGLGVQRRSNGLAMQSATSPSMRARAPTPSCRETFRRVADCMGLGDSLTPSRSVPAGGHFLLTFALLAFPLTTTCAGLAAVSFRACLA